MVVKLYKVNFVCSDFVLEFFLVLSFASPMVCSFCY